MAVCQRQGSKMRAICSQDQAAQIGQVTKCCIIVLYSVVVCIVISDRVVGPDVDGRPRHASYQGGGNAQRVGHGNAIKMILVSRNRCGWATSRRDSPSRETEFERQEIL